MTDPFVHLHVHTDYSILDGAARISALFAEAARLDQPAIAMTDHGNLHGAEQFYRTSLGHPGVKPIIGMEAYVAPADRRLREPVSWGLDKAIGDVSGAGAYTHMTLLARDATGLRNLFRLSSRASSEGFYRKPRIDRELLAEHAEGLIGTTGCPGGEVCTRLALGQYEAARQAAGDFRDILGPENYLLELMDHGCAVERQVREGLLRVGRDLDLIALATNDSHYVTADQAQLHDALLCVQTRSTLATEGRFRFDGSGYHLKSAGEMRSHWDRELPGACDATLAVAQRIESYADVFALRDLMPQVEPADGRTADQRLLSAVEPGVTARFPGGLNPVHVDRLAYELAVIERMGFAGYFLVVKDLVDWARSQGIAIGPGRGSAAGSLVCYLLGISGLDPIDHDLMFERFLNPERVSPPDVDLDFEESRRGEVVAYLHRRWGADRVAQIATFGTIRTRAAVKDAARVLYGPAGHTLASALIAALPPAVHAIDVPLADMLDPESVRYDESGRFRDVITAVGATLLMDLGTGLEGLVRQVGVHACGVVLAGEPLIDLVPLWTRRSDGAVVTSWDNWSCERIGLLKIDVLSSRTIEVIARTAREVGIDIETLPMDDGPTFDLLRSGRTVGVFQLESAGAQQLVRQVAPTRFADISAVLALYRPGPMGMGAHREFVGRRKTGVWAPIHPELVEALAPILDETYGLFVYQEQIITAARVVAGYSLGRADILRRAMGKKKRSVLDAEREGFFEGGRGRGYPVEALQALWDTMVPWTDYGFVRAHAAAYALIAYRCAWLKARHPVRFMAAQLASVQDDPDRRAAYLAECRRMGITVLGPCVNESGPVFRAM